MKSDGWGSDSWYNSAEKLYFTHWFILLEFSWCNKNSVLQKLVLSNPTHTAINDSCKSHTLSDGHKSPRRKFY